MSCLNPEHDDNNPSMRIDRITGVYNCFSCGFKGNIFNHFDAPSNPLDIRREKVRRKIDEKRASSVGLKMPKNFMPYVGNWRGLHQKHISCLEHFYTQINHLQAEYLFQSRT